MKMLDFENSLIEYVFPVEKVSMECQKEKMAGSGQTLTCLGSYWKGRKPLFLVRACVLGCLLPVSNDLGKDLKIFEKLLLIDDDSFKYRVKRPKDWPLVLDLSYLDRLKISYRPEELDGYVLEDYYWKEVNEHLETDAKNLVELVEQLSFRRYGRKVKVADVFCGSGSIPFEAARLGCDVYASDLNPVATMLTWASFNVIGATNQQKQIIDEEQKRISKAVDKYVTDLGIEHDENGNRAKCYLYCIEVKCTDTGWLVPLMPSFVISVKRRVIAKLVPDYKNKRYDIDILSGVDDESFEKAKIGTVRKGYVCHPNNPNDRGVSIRFIRGDYKNEHGKNRNRLRAWQKTDFIPRKDDVFQERLYCIQWFKGNTKETFFAKPTDKDLDREKEVIGMVEKNLVEWQEKGFIPDMKIDDGKDIVQPKRERGWQYWHHLFNPRQLLILSKYIEESQKPESKVFNLRVLNYSSRLCIWNTMCLKTEKTFYNQALNTFFNYGCRGFKNIDSNRYATSMVFNLKMLDFYSNLCFWQKNADKSIHIFYNQNLNTFLNYSCRGFKNIDSNRYASSMIFNFRSLDCNSRMCRWRVTHEKAENTFYNQALNTFFNYGCRGFKNIDSNRYASLSEQFNLQSFKAEIDCQGVEQLNKVNDIYITDPPYGDSVRYHEITDFFIAWMRKNPPRPFRNWNWSSQKDKAIKGENNDFRIATKKAYQKTVDKMNDNGIQIIMFAHQSKKLWSMMIDVFLSVKLRAVTSWYITTETTSALKKTKNLKGTGIFVLKKRKSDLSASFDDVFEQVELKLKAKLDVFDVLRKGFFLKDIDLFVIKLSIILEVLTNYVYMDGICLIDNVDFIKSTIEKILKKLDDL